MDNSREHKIYKCSEGKLHKSPESGEMEQRHRTLWRGGDGGWAKRIQRTSGGG